MMESKGYKNRRKSIRHPLKLSYDFTLEDNIYTGITGNVSLTGVFLETISPEIPSRYTNMTILLRMILGKKEFSTMAKIVYISDSKIPLMNGVGIEFITPQQEMIRMLKNYIFRQTNYSSVF